MSTILYFPLRFISAVFSILPSTIPCSPIHITSSPITLYSIFLVFLYCLFFFSSRRRHTRWPRDWSSDVCSSDLSQSERPLIHQLDAYHIQQSINRTFGYRKSKWKRKVRQALKDHDKDQLTVILDTYESQLEDEAHIEKLNEFKGYIFNHWDYIPDWRTRIKHSPSDARGLGAMESNQRRITFRMKKRGMHWSKAGAEAMVKIKQGMFNQTLRDVYLSSQRRSHRKQRDVRKKVRLSSILRQSTRPSIGVRRASIVVHAAHSSAIGRLYKAIR